MIFFARKLGIWIFPLVNLEILQNLSAKTHLEFIGFLLWISLVPILTQHVWCEQQAFNPSYRGLRSCRVLLTSRNHKNDKINIWHIKDTRKSFFVAFYFSKNSKSWSRKVFLIMHTFDVRLTCTFRTTMVIR